MRRAALFSGLAVLALACNEQTQPTVDAPPSDPLAGRSRHTIVYGGNIWGDLLECG